MLIYFKQWILTLTLYNIKKKGLFVWKFWITDSCESDLNIEKPFISYLGSWSVGSWIATRFLQSLALLSANTCTHSFPFRFVTDQFCLSLDLNLLWTDTEWEIKQDKPETYGHTQPHLPAVHVNDCSRVNVHELGR